MFSYLSTSPHCKPFGLLVYPPHDSIQHFFKTKPFHLHFLSLIFALTGLSIAHSHRCLFLTVLAHHLRKYTSDIYWRKLKLLCLVHDSFEVSRRRVRRLWYLLRYHKFYSFHIGHIRVKEVELAFFSLLSTSPSIPLFPPLTTNVCSIVLLNLRWLFFIEVIFRPVFSASPFRSCIVYLI